MASPGRDVLITALQKLEPGYKETFTRFHPAFDALIDKGNKSRLSNPFHEFTLVPEGPGTLNAVTNGDEFIDGGRRQTAVRGFAYAHTMVYAYDVPYEDYRTVSGEADIAGLIKRYPERALADFQEMIARQFCMGDQAGAEGFFTLNGDATYNPKMAGAQSGMFEFAAPALQNSTRFGVVSNSILNWHTQYRHITSVGANGYKQLRSVYYDASQQGASASGDVDIMFSDRDSYDNLLDELQDYIQFVKPETQVAKGDPAPSRMRKGLKFLDATLYPEPTIDRSLFVTPNAQLGVVYGVKSDTLNLFTQGSAADKETAGDFEMRYEGRIGYQELDRHEIVTSMGFWCDDLRCNFAATGTAIP